MINKTLAHDVATKYFQARLLAWYDHSARDLPWRRDRDPYRVWVSEIMLQQTRVAAVIEHYHRFLKRFPSIGKLAAAREASVLAAWSGLGYYRRARMLHAAAKKIVRQHAGQFPAEALRSLPGIGRYTAAAIGSIAFNQPVAVVDGNVERVLERLTGKDLPAEAVWKQAQALLSTTRPGDFNQAMMELGATICIPGEPKCAACPVMEFCATKGTRARPEKENRRRRDIRYALARRNGSVLLTQRPKNASLMPGMWELPEAVNQRKKASFTLRHSITVTDYRVHVIDEAASDSIGGRWVSKSRAQALPLTGLARKILRAAKFI